MYDRSSATTNVNESRLDLFAGKQRTHESISPTHAALKEHVKHAAYQAGILWAQATDPQPDIKSPADYGWIKDGDTWRICFTTLTSISAKLPVADKVFVQEGLHKEMQMHRTL